MSGIEWYGAVWDYLLARFGIDPRREGGLAATEIAVLAVILIGGAIYVGTQIIGKAKDNANNIPSP